MVIAKEGINSFQDARQAEGEHEIFLGDPTTRLLEIAGIEIDHILDKEAADVYRRTVFSLEQVHSTWKKGTQ